MKGLILIRQLILILFFVFKINSKSSQSDSEKKQLLIGLNNSYILLDKFIINQCQIGYKGLLCSKCDRSASYYKIADVAKMFR